MIAMPVMSAHSFSVATLGGSHWDISRHSSVCLHRPCLVPPKVCPKFRLNFLLRRMVFNFIFVNRRWYHKVANGIRFSPAQHSQFGSSVQTRSGCLSLRHSARRATPFGSAECCLWARFAGYAHDANVVQLASAGDGALACHLCNGGRHGCSHVNHAKLVPIFHSHGGYRFVNQIFTLNIFNISWLSSTLDRSIIPRYVGFFVAAGRMRRVSHASSLFDACMITFCLILQVL